MIYYFHHGKKSDRNRKKSYVSIAQDKEALGKEVRMEEQKVTQPILETAIFGGGCFWCTEAIFKSLKGVVSVAPGYTGGTVANPTYEQVSAGNTGHVESIRLEFDPSVISYDDLLSVFFNTHDPTTFNRQGNDVGTEYNSSIFYTTDEQKRAAESLVAELNSSKAYEKPVITTVRPLDKFYEAESYHHDYYAANKEAPYCQLVIAPKLEKLQERFKALLK